MCWSVFCIACFLLYSSGVRGESIRTHSQPVVLNMKKYNNELCSTKPQFFQQVLGLQSGSPFKLNFDKWRSLKQSKLFSNLTASMANAPDGSVYLNISGVEQPSMHFAPEVGMSGVQLDNPEIFGGVSSQSTYKLHFVVEDLY